MCKWVRIVLGSLMGDTNYLLQKWHVCLVRVENHFLIMYYFLCVCSDLHIVDTVFVELVNL